MQRIVTELLALPKAPDWSFWVQRGYFGRKELVLCWREAGRSMPDGHGEHRRVVYAYDDRRLRARIDALLAADDPAVFLDAPFLTEEVRRDMARRMRERNR